jgi:hypothetical protein
VPGCAYAGLLLHDHILDAHSSAASDEDDAVVSFARFAASAEVALRQNMSFRVLLMHVTSPAGRGGRGETGGGGWIGRRCERPRGRCERMERGF